MTDDDEREARIRRTCSTGAYFVSDNELFLVRRLDEAREGTRFWEARFNEGDAIYDSCRAMLIASQEDAARLRGEIDRLRDANHAAREGAIAEAERAAKGADSERGAANAIAAAYIQGRLDARADVRALGQRKPEPLTAETIEEAESRTIEACALHIEGGGWGMQTVGEAIRAFGRERAAGD